MNSAVGSEYDRDNSCGAAEPVEMTSGTPAFFNACANTAPPPTGGVPMLVASSSTANGFIAATVTASARWAASPSPVVLTNSNSTVRPQVS